MHDEAVRDWVDRAYEILNFPKQPEDIELPSYMDIVLDYSLRCYYLTIFTSQRLFWLVEVNVYLVTQNLRQVIS